MGLGALLYDNVPGGAGHVRELLERGEDWLKLARRTLYVDEAHDARCKSAFLDCLLSFDTQTASSQNLLNRRRALQALDDLIGGEGVPHIDSGSIDHGDGSDETVATVSQQQSVEDRLNRARSRRNKRRGRSRRR